MKVVIIEHPDSWSKAQDAAPRGQTDGRTDETARGVARVARACVACVRGDGRTCREALML